MSCLGSKAVRVNHSLKFLKGKKQISTAPSTVVETFPKSFTEIPSPKGLPILGTTLSLIMAGSAPQLHNYIDKRHRKLGPIFKENVGPVSCVFVSDPEAMRAIYAHEGKYPVHLLPDAWITYNNLHNVSRGLLFMNGEEWLHFRRILNPLLLKGPQRWLEDCCGPAVESLLTNLQKAAISNCSPNIEKLLYRWALEVLVTVLIGVKSFEQNKLQFEEKFNELANVVQLIFETSSKMQLVSASFAAKHKISRWRKFEDSVTHALQASADLVDSLTQINFEDSEGLLKKLIGQMTKNELAKIVTDLILASGDTTAYAMEWILYSVAKHPEVQKKLKQEIQTSRDEGHSPISNTYLKNVVKEALRLYPVAPFLTRILPEPVILSGYTIPAGTVLILSIFTTGRDESNFKNPLVFDPDRWARSEIKSSIVQSAALPFAIGARSCIGKKLAEFQLQKTLAEVVSHFNIEVLNEDDVKVVLKMVAVPDREIRFKFTPL